MSPQKKLVLNSGTFEEENYVCHSQGYGMCYAWVIEPC